MDIWSLVIMLLSIVAGGFLRFVISEPKVLFALAMVVLLLIVGYLSAMQDLLLRAERVIRPESVALRHCRWG